MEVPAHPRLTTLFGEFPDPFLERAYRLHARAADQRLMAIVTAIVLGSFFLVSLGEWYDHGTTLTGDAWNRLVIRTAAVPVCALLVFSGIRRMGAPAGDRILAAVILAGLLLAVYLQLLWPPEFVGATYVLVFIIYLKPIPLRLLAPVSLVFSAAMFWLFLAYKRPVVPDDREFILWGIVCFNLIGFLSNRHVGAQRRFAYYAGLQERAAREESERARQELRILEGLIPICSTCKKIRDDAGDWHQMEKYIAEHSEAQFTHGICETCAVEFLRGTRERA